MMKPRQSTVRTRTASCNSGDGVPPNPGRNCEPSSPATNSAEKSATFVMQSVRRSPARGSQLRDHFVTKAGDPFAQRRLARERPIRNEAVHAHIGEALHRIEIERAAP